MKIVSYRHKWSSKIFTDKKKYIKELEEIRKLNRMRHTEERHSKNFANWFAKEKENLHTAKEIFDWIIDNTRMIVNYYNYTCKHNSVRTRISPDIKLTFYGYNDKIIDASNMYCCPKDGVTNLFRSNDNGLPKSYPGCHFRLVIGVENDEGHCFTTDMLKLVDIHTRAGGGSYTSKDFARYSYNTIIFLSDYPGLHTTRIADLIKTN